MEKSRVLNVLRSDDRRLSILWTILRVWLGWQWFSAGLEKLSNPQWMSGLPLKGFWTKAIMTPKLVHYGWYKGFLTGMLHSGSYVWFAKLVALGEFLTGVALILGVATFAVLLIGAFMNLNYMLAGTASSNPVLYTLSIILLLTGSAAWYYGVDRFLFRYLQGPRQEHRHPATAQAHTQN